MDEMRAFALFTGAALAVGCGGGPTTRHLISVGDEVRVTVTADQAQAQPPTQDWAALNFVDSNWPARVTAFAATVDTGPSQIMVRRTFDIGADYEAFHTLTLSFDPHAPFDVYLNGERLLENSTATTATLTPREGLLRGSGNVLALQVHAPASGDLDISFTLDGDADADAGAGNSARVVRGPWLMAPRADGMTIVWETDRDAASQVIVDGHPIDGGSGTHHVAHVGGLEATHTYKYHVETGSRVGAEFELTTAPADTSAPLRFLAYGDNRTNGDAHRRIVDAMRAEGADFAVNSGDLVASSSADEWQTFFDIEYGFMASTPIFPALGNHEENSGGAGRFAELFPLGSPDVFHGRVYSFDFGSVHMAVLDSNTNLADQAPWLDRDLTAATARGARHLFVMMHWGAYSGRKYLQHGSNMDARKYIVPVARKHNIDALIAGHDHFYERGDADNLPYFVTGGGGAPLADTGHGSETQMARSTHHYVVFDVSGGRVHVTAKDATGAAFDQVDIWRGPSVPPN
jgi:hypothetical protein